jgi:hypothetical protein
MVVTNIYLISYIRKLKHAYPVSNIQRGGRGEGEEGSRGGEGRERN